MVIDLGLERDAAPPAPPPGWWRSAARLRSAAAVACLVLLPLLAGAAPPTGPVLTQVVTHSLDVRDLVLLGDRLLVSSPDPKPGLNWLMSAYELPSGRHLWTAPHDSPTSELQELRLTNDLILLTVQPGTASAGATIVLDATTGHTRWTGPAGLVPIAGGNVGVVHAPDTVYGVDLATGRELWRIEVSQPAIVLPAPGGRVALVGPGGRVELRDARTGGLDRSRVLSDGGAPQIVEDTLILRDRRDGTPGVIGYDLATLERRWSRVVTDGLGRLTQCGPLVCFPISGGIEAVHPATGVPAWRARGDLIVDFAGYLIAFDMSDSVTGRARIIQPVTGRTVGALGDWETSLPTRGEATFVGVRRKAGPEPGTLLAVLPPGADAVQVLGTVPQRLSNCVAGTASIACRSNGKRLSIWRYRI